MSKKDENSIWGNDPGCLGMVIIFLILMAGCAIIGCISSYSSKLDAEAELMKKQVEKMDQKSCSPKPNTDH